MSPGLIATGGGVGEIAQHQASNFGKGVEEAAVLVMPRRARADPQARLECGVLGRQLFYPLLALRWRLIERGIQQLIQLGPGRPRRASPSASSASLLGVSDAVSTAAEVDSRDTRDYEARRVVKREERRRSTSSTETMAYHDARRAGSRLRSRSCTRSVAMCADRSTPFSVESNR